MVYINQLHLTVVMLLTGRIKLVEKADDKDGKAPDKEVVVAQEPEKAAQTCSAEQKAKVKELIAAYVKTGPLGSPTPQRRPPTGAARGGPAAAAAGPGCRSSAGQEVGPCSRAAATVDGGPRQPVSSHPTRAIR